VFELKRTSLPGKRCRAKELPLSKLECKQRGQPVKTSFYQFKPV